ncbi:conserved Plasmodium protein, unknown function [Plasmodium vinckei vinckei]|uniref:Uncharacterized protein n=1 Tax=Plasmodium vinckei vinckei TaxID=54757 RepID=A0A449BZY3_PLAVN|nr:conserved Plasmodium protein, unknown function [Plasmodium vinckei vinckei]KEG04247.1 hypothetical protein YYE_01153 [Plasmodium vinckei vinckei]VEV58952.1 conserved Plasmodium protein, unknown function [Plasmodium vinckei vinckei]
MGMSHAEIAKQLKYNSAEIREYFEDLYKWQDDIKKKEIEDNEKKKNKLENNNIKKCTDNYSFGKRIGEPTKVDVASNTKDFNQKDENSLNSQNDIFVKKKIIKETNKVEVVEDSDHSINNDPVYKLNKEKKDFETNEKEISQTKLCDHRGNNKSDIDKKPNECINICQNEEEIKLKLNLSNENSEIAKASNKAIDIYLCKNEEGKINYKNEKYSKCLENYNDIINYIDFELKKNNIFIEIEKYYDNELQIDVISNNYYLNNKKTKDLFILRTKTLINRSLVFQRLSSYYESIKDCTCIIIFFNKFLHEQIENKQYCIHDLISINVTYIIFKAYYLRGIARYKLKIYKQALKDFKHSSDYVKYVDSGMLVTINKYIQLIQNKIKQNNIKKYERIQYEYTSTHLDHFQLKKKLVTIEVISKDITKEDMNNQIKDTTQNYNCKELENSKKIYHRMCKTEISNVKSIEKEETKKKESIDSESEENEETQPSESVTKVIEEEDRNGKSLINKYLSNPIDLKVFNNEEIIDSKESQNEFVSSNSSESISKNFKIKNKINFEILWNSDEVKNNFKHQMNILKMAFLEENIFNFHLDKDMYVDILDHILKNLCAISLGENKREIRETQIDDIKNYKHEESSKRMFEDKFKNDKNGDIFLGTYSEYYENLINIFYMMTNNGKENYIFLFIDKKEKEFLKKLYNIILEYSNSFINSDSCLKEKIVLLKKLL